MPNRAIELHDSRLLELRAEPEGGAVTLDVYVHESEGRAGIDPGVGYVQRAQLLFSDLRLENPPSLPTAIRDGVLWLDEESFPNVIPLPLRYSGSVALELVCADGSTTLRASGVTVMLSGPAGEKEEFP